MRAERGIAVMVILLLGSGAWGAGLWKRAVRQPIAFNHQKHVTELGMECTDCHRHALDGARATIPNVDVCSECHAEPQTEGAEEALVVKHVQEGVPIPWRQVSWVPDHVYFSHRRHTAIGGIDCQTCHGNIRERAKPLTAPLEEMSMAACIDCHERANVTTDCVACHM